MSSADDLAHELCSMELIRPLPGGMPCQHCNVRAEALTAAGWQQRPEVSDEALTALLEAFYDEACAATLSDFNPAKPEFPKEPTLPIDSTIQRLRELFGG